MLLVVMVVVTGTAVELVAVVVTGTAAELVAVVMTVPDLMLQRRAR